MHNPKMLGRIALVNGVSPPEVAPFLVLCMSQTLSIVVPAHNEVENIRPLLDEIMSVAKSLPVAEVIVIDDASVDQTDQELLRARVEMPLLRILQHRHKAGQSAAIYTGVLAATGDWIVTLDGDGQNDPADILKLYQFYAADPSREKVGLVAGQRARRRDKFIKRISSRVANTVRAALLQDGVRDTGCGLKMIRRDVYLRLPYFNHMHRYIPALVRREGLDIRLVDVGHRHRQRGISKYGTLDRLVAGLSDLFGVVWLIHRRRVPQTPKSL